MTSSRTPAPQSRPGCARAAAGARATPTTGRARPRGAAAVKGSFVEAGGYQTPVPLPAEWPAAPANYSPEAGDKAYQTMIERLEYVEKLGFDWMSLSEHHYSPRILTPSPIVSAAYVAARIKRIKIALLGPIVPQANPIRIAEELAMVDTMSQGRLVVGLLRGTSN